MECLAASLMQMVMMRMVLLLELSPHLVMIYLHFEISLIMGRKWSELFLLINWKQMDNYPFGHALGMVVMSWISDLYDACCIIPGY